MSISAEPQISLGQLRQNPTEMVRHVRDGERYILTDRGRPVARIVPFSAQGWVSAERAGAAFRSSVDGGWRQELRRDREGSDLADPFAR